MTLGKNMAIAVKYSNCWQNNLENPKIMDGQILFTESNWGGVATNSPQFGVWAPTQHSTMPHCKNNYHRSCLGVEWCWLSLCVHMLDWETQTKTPARKLSCLQFLISELSSLRLQNNSQIKNWIMRRRMWQGTDATRVNTDITDRSDIIIQSFYKVGRSKI